VKNKVSANGHELAMLLSSVQRQKLLEKVSKIVTEHFNNTDPAAEGWPAAIERHKDRIVNAVSDEEFEVQMLALLAELKRSHVGFFHQGLSRSSSKMVLSATYLAASVSDSEYWAFQDVHATGPAALAGIRPGDVLLSVDGRTFRPPEHPLFAANSKVMLRILTKGMREESRTVEIPPAKISRGQLPQVYPSTVVSHKHIRSGVGYLRIALYPGEIGVDVANDISLAIDKLGTVERLIIDLRGNTGGGIGVLRAMSILTPDRIPVGRFAGGGVAPVSGAEGYHFVFDKVPSTKSGLLRLGVRYFGTTLPRKALGRKTPILITTEGLGPKPFHGRVVLLVNRHTASANEMLVAFAREHGLAKVVGEPTPGRVLGGAKFSLSHGYWLALPVGSYQSKAGEPLEGKPIEPDAFEPFDPDSAREGVDKQLDRALEVVSLL
jgi:C-terminal processing protease CtpA/Prc